METESTISPEIRKILLRYQRIERTDHLLYSRLARREKNEHNRRLLACMAADEQGHADLWERYAGERVGPSRALFFWGALLSVIFGYTFVLKLMERKECAAYRAYQVLAGAFPETGGVIKDEQAHEKQLADMLNEERLRYVGAMVLGLNDALVELSGALAGLTLALADTRLVALAGIITGASATLSMAASSYLAERADGRRDALRSSLYTGAAYLVTVVCLVAPYLLFPRGMYLSALAVMLGAVILIILVFNYYVAVAKSLPFGPRFREMAGISLGVAVISFAIGLLAKHLLGVEL